MESLSVAVASVDEREVANHPASTLLDRSLLSLVLAGPLLSITVNRVVDGAHTVYDVNGVSTGVGGGGHATLFTDLLLGAATLLLSGLVVLRGIHERRGSFTWVGAFAVLAALVFAWRDSTSLAFNAIVGAVAVVGAGFMRFDRRSLATVGWFTLCSVVVNFVYTVLLHPPDAWVPCRPDKCTAAGQLFEGIFWAENGMAMYFLALIPFIAFIGPRFWRHFTLFGAVTAVYLSGSRVGYLAAVVAVAAFIALRGMQRVPEETQENAWRAPNSVLARLRPVVRSAALLPLLATIGSLVLLCFLPGSGLSERGSVYESVRAVFPVDPIFGPGLLAVQNHFQLGHATFLMYNEHGVAPYVLNEVGLVGAVLFVGALVTLWLRSATWVGACIALSILGITCMFMTEAAVSIGYTAGSQFLVLLAVASSQGPARTRPWRPWRRRARTTPMTMRDSTSHVWGAAGVPLCLLVVVGAAIGGIVSTQRSSEYIATTARVSLPQATGISDPTAGDDGSTMTEDLVHLFDVRGVSSGPGGDLQGVRLSDLRVTNPEGNVIRFSYTDGDPQVASRVVTEVSAEAVERIRSYGGSGGTYPVISPVEVLHVQSHPVWVVVYGALGGVAASLILFSWLMIRCWCGLMPRKSWSRGVQAHG